MSFEAMACPNGHLTYPTHTRCPECGEHPSRTIDLSDRTGTVITWTTSTSAPPGVREPNTLAIVEFEIDGDTVRAIGGVTTDEISIGATVEPVYVEELRDPAAGIKDSDSQEWDGYRFRPI
ncbi:MAG: Zn-ribbon domain-containing OB-fold protein [Halobacteriales archaeon]